MTKYLSIALINAIISFVLFRGLYLRTGNTRLRAVLATSALALATPAVLFCSNYLLQVPDAVWFINFHSLPGIEASSGLVGALLGVAFASVRLRPRSLNIPIPIISTAAAAALMLAPFAKQMLFRLDYSKLENRWANNICLQTSQSTCVPASCATVTKTLGGNVTERELAIEAGTNQRGTEIWYMKRALQRRGYELTIHTANSPKDFATPSILGVTVGRSGHVVVLISKTPTGPEIADPLGTHKTYTWQAFERKYHPKSTYVQVHRK